MWVWSTLKKIFIPFFLVSTLLNCKSRLCVANNFLIEYWLVTRCLLLDCIFDYWDTFFNWIFLVYIVYKSFYHYCVMSDDNWQPNVKWKSKIGKLGKKKLQEAVIIIISPKKPSIYSQHGNNLHEWIGSNTTFINDRSPELGSLFVFSTKNNSHSDIAISRIAKVQFKVGYTANESQINCQNVELYKTQ